MNYLNSLKYNGYNNYGCGTIALHNAMIWANNSLNKSVDKNLSKIADIIKEENHQSTVGNINKGLQKLKRKKIFENATLEDQVNIQALRDHLKNKGSIILLSFDSKNKVGHYEFYRYENGLVYESDTLSSFREIAKKINTKNQHNLTPEVWFIS